MSSKFLLGRIVITPGAIEALAGESPFTYLKKHMSGDWGEVSKADAKENDFSVKNGFRILSSYALSTGQKIWLITEADRSSTCILLPEEY